MSLKHLLLVAAALILACSKGKSEDEPWDAAVAEPGLDASTPAGLDAGSDGVPPANATKLVCGSNRNFVEQSVFAANATHLFYWSSNESQLESPKMLLFSVPLAGGTPTELGLAPLDLEIESMVVDATDVTWVHLNDDAIYKVPLAGGTPSLVYDSTLGLGTQLRTDGSTLYFLEGSKVVKLAAGATSTTTLSNARQQTFTLAIDATDAYFSHNPTYKGWIYKTPLAATDATQEVLVYDNMALMQRQLEVAGNDLLWISGNNQGAQGIMVGPKAGGATRTIGPAAVKIATDGTSVWALTADATGWHKKIVKIDIASGQQQDHTTLTARGTRLILAGDKIVFDQVDDGVRSFCLFTAPK